MQRKRPFLPALAVIGAIAIAASVPIVPKAHAESAPKPNILMVLVDDLGFGDLSSYGATDLQSPGIDELVGSGIRFDNFYANCPVCSPTLASLLTGRYQELVGVPGVIRTHDDNNWGYLAPDAVFLPEVLKRAGYHTAIVEKWHLGLEEPNRPNDRAMIRVLLWASQSSAYVTTLV
ncbi:MAG: sulfatase-like hydrolase/transferase [Planctomycetes bacterium]|nr:sulfatase-like hydrolase/transferase [Planctomycetota bacterium]MBL7040044.1 sulfatase-like hydrolase/transferase [Pirellulaceae bacterium]